MAALASVSSARKAGRGAFWATTIIAWLYVGVVASGLACVLPVSPDSAGSLLGMVLITDGTPRYI